MSDWGSECESAVNLAECEVAKLHSLNPQDNLLRFWITPPQDLLPNGKPDPEKEEANRTEMKRRWWNGTNPHKDEAGIIVTAMVTINYFLAVREAVAHEVQKQKLCCVHCKNPFNTSDVETGIEIVRGGFVHLKKCFFQFQRKKKVA